LQRTGCVREAEECHKRECIKTKAVCKFAKKIKIVRETYTDT